MERKTMMYGVRVVVVGCVFSCGYLCGSLTQKNADAQMGDIGGELMKKASGSGGMVGNIAQMGTAISDMEKQVSGLQKNLGILKNIRTSLLHGK